MRNFSRSPKPPNLVGGDNWFWLDDNAKILEFLSRPEVWRRFPDQTLEMLRFARWMCRGPFMFRADQLAAPGAHPAATARAGYRRAACPLADARPPRPAARDGRGRRALPRCAERGQPASHRQCRKLCASRPPLSRQCRGRDPRLSTRFGQGDVLSLRHSSELFFKVRSAERRLGRITYEYPIDARSMLFGVEADARHPAADLADVEITIAHDQLSHGLNDVHYGTVAVAVPGAEPRSLVAGEPGQHRIAAAGAPYYSIAQVGDRRVRARHPQRAAAARAADRAGCAGAAARQAASGPCVVPVSGFVPRRAPGRRRGQAAHGGRVLFANCGLRRADA